MSCLSWKTHSKNIAWVKGTSLVRTWSVHHVSHFVHALNVYVALSVHLNVSVRIHHQIQTQDWQTYCHWEMMHTGNFVLLDTLKLALQASILCFVSLSIISSLFLRTIVFPVYFTTWTLLLYILHKTPYIPISLKFTQSRSSNSIWNLN